MPRAKLESAGKTYGACARAVQAGSATPTNPTAQESELLIGFGIASDWVRRAAALEPLQYDKRLMNKSPKSPAVAELVRFTMAWSGLNALFARPEVLKLLGGTSATSELKLFQYLLANSGLSAATIGGYENTLRALLSAPVISAIPGHPLGTAFPSLQVLHEKFTPRPYRTKGVGKTIQDAIHSGNYSLLDLATIVYAMRNWSVHGGLIGSSFRSVPRFNAFIGTVLSAIADVHAGVSGALLAKI
ncbi:hypothetical protein [Variovorax sp. 22077]|uniref:hypothetical protein n=1 Tax=Variovorax sp. 22077 TaxID=3453867 RepID=UPI003F863C49